MDPNPWVEDQVLEISGSRFIVSPVPPSEVGDHFAVIKTPRLVRKYLALFAREQPRTIVELGIKEGGSTALIALAADPALLLAVDLEADIPALLSRLIDDLDLGTRVLTAFGLDQGDRSALTRFVDSHSVERGFDLVIDDASHMLGPTRTSFEVLFPRLRPGGLYVVEDWRAEYLVATHLARTLPADADEFSARLGSVNQLLHIMNSPEHDLPDGVMAGIAQGIAERLSAHGAETDALRDSFFDSVVSAAGRWDIDELEQSTFPRGRPLVDLAVELMMIAATNPDVVDEVRVDAEWLSARRGTADLPRDTFRLKESWTDYYGYLR